MNLHHLKAIRAQLNYSYPKNYKMLSKKKIKEAHQITVSKGFWDEPRDQAELLNLIRSEIGEVVEAHRAGKVAPSEADVTLALSLTERPEYAQFYKDNLKGYVSEELADVCLRCYDLVASNDEWLELFLQTNKNFKPKDTFHKELQRAYYWSVYASSLSKAIKPYVKLVVGLHGVVCSMINLAQMLDINLEEHIELKMAYNKTRPVKHGKNY